MSEHHFIKHVHDGDTMKAVFECTSPKTAECHQYRDCGCDVACDHPAVPQPKCWLDDWMHEVCAQECFDGPKGTLVTSGPILASWNGDCASWEYAPQPHEPELGR